MERQGSLRAEANLFYMENASCMLQQAREAPASLESNNMFMTGNGKTLVPLVKKNEPECLSLLTNHFICPKDNGCS